jgi:hypothetical protein
MRFRQIRLHAPAGSRSVIDDFYADRLGFERLDGEGVGVNVGETQLVFRVGAGRPFYHFAVLVPGNRFDEALAWIADRTVLLPDPASGEVLFDFDNWGALACYFHDPVGNIVELIAHRGIEESSAEGSFTARELVGFSELGLVGDKAEMATALQTELGLEQWDGDIADEATLAFVGEKARTFILSSEGRGWLPTGRPAEPHPCEVVLSEAPTGQTLIGGSRYKVRGTAS